MYPRMQLVPTIRSSNTCLLASCLVWNYGEGGGEKRKKLVWKLAVFKAFGVKGGVRCYRKVAVPFADIWVTENVGIQKDWLPWETHPPVQSAITEMAHERQFMLFSIL